MLTTESDRISGDTMLPDLFQAYPQARSLFDRYGLSGCGGEHGPVESVHFFARAHGVPEDQLLGEISAAINSVETFSAARPEPIDSVYRRFFTAGILLVLTTGASWGAWLLWRIGLGGSFTGVSILQVNAHGYAQIFGWVGLFIMGFGYQAFPRMWHGRLVWPALAGVAFVLAALGVLVGAIGMASAGASWAVPLATAGSLMEVVAATIFAAQILVTFARSGKPVEPYVGFVAAALTWFVLMSAASAWHTWRTMTAATDQQLLWQVATYQAPLRDLQIHGLALFMILGVSTRMLPPLFGVPETPPRRAWWALGLLITAVLAEIAVFLAYRWTGVHAIAAGLLGAWALLLIGVALVALPWRLWRTPAGAEPPDRSFKFVRAAYAWLGISLLMLLLLPAYQAASRIPFSHAYYGSIRHAITVGFVSLMIMGFAAKVVPTLNGIDVRALTRLWGPFLLVNTGCALRVFLQTLADWWRPAFALVGISGMLEIAGLAWWGLGLLVIIQQGRREAAASAAPSGPAPACILPEHRVADVLAWFPHTEPVFHEYGFTLLKNPLLRRTLARQVTLATAVSLRKVPAAQFLADLNRAAVADRLRVISSS